MRCCLRRHSNTLANILRLTLGQELVISDNDRIQKIIGANVPGGLKGADVDSFFTAEHRGTIVFRAGRIMKEEHDAVLEERYKALGGDITVINQ